MDWSRIQRKRSASLFSLSLFSLSKCRGCEGRQGKGISPSQLRQPLPLSLSPRRFLRFLSTKAPSLHRHCPASSVLRASPSPHTARPGSRELPVDRLLLSPLGLPVLRLIHYACMPSPLPRQGRWNRFARTVPSSSAFPTLQLGRLLHYMFRGLLSVSSRYNLQTHRVAVCDPLHRRLRRLCCLHRRSSCYRVERSSSRLSPAVVQRLSRRTVVAWLRQISSSRVEVSLVPSSLCGHLSPWVELMESVVSDQPVSVRNLWKVIEVLGRIRTRVLLTSNPRIEHVL